MSAATTADPKEASSHGADDHHHDDHHDPSFVEKYIFSTDHKTIGIQYAITGLAFLFFGFFLMMIMRWSIAFPTEQLPAWLAWFPNILQGGLDRWAPDGLVNGELYNMLGAMHGTIMVFLGIVPIAFAAFGNYVMPLQIGAPDMTFPKLNMWSYWLYFVGGVVMLGSFFVPSGAAQSGWTNYSPLASLAQPANGFWEMLVTGQTLWLLAMVFLISSSLLGSVNFITTIINLRAKGLTWMRLPFFVWAMLVVAFLLLLAFPPLEVAAVMQLMDRLAGTSFFMPTGLVEGDQVLPISGGGSPLLYQHLFWFLAHPEVYVLILPGIAIVSEIIPANTPPPTLGLQVDGLRSSRSRFPRFHRMGSPHVSHWNGEHDFHLLPVHHRDDLGSFGDPAYLSHDLSLWGGSIRFTTPMLFATAFLPMFGFGGLTGLPLAFNLIDLHLHDTYYVIAHFHYIVAPGTIFAIFAGIYHWYPKATGRYMSHFWGHVHFWPSLICMNGIFLPMFVQGMAGFHRRWWDGGKYFEDGMASEYLYLNEYITYFVYALAIAQIPFIINFFVSAKIGKKVESDNPWGATTLEWATPTPPGHGNFLVEPVVYRDPYEYSVPRPRGRFHTPVPV